MESLQNIYNDIVSNYYKNNYNNNLNTNNTNINNNSNNNTILDSTTQPVVSQQPFDWNSYLGNLSSYQKTAQSQAAQDALTDSPLLQQVKARASGPQSTIPTTQQEFMDLYGKTPEGGWTDKNTYAGNQDTALQGWLTDKALLPKMNLYGSGSQEDIQKGFNVLQHYAPRNIGEFWNLGSDVQKAMLEHPDAALSFMQQSANPANEDWLSVGAEGGFSDPTAYQTQNGQFGVDPSKYMQIHDGGLLHSVFKFADPILDKVDPLHNPMQNLITNGMGFQNQEQAFSTIAPMVLNAFFPGAGSAVTAADAASRGDIPGAAISGAGAAMSLAGSPGMTGNPLYDRMITQATTSGLSTANRGGSLGDIFRDAALSGLGAYASGNTGLSELTGLSQPMTNMLTSGGMNVLNQMVRQGEIDPAQLAIAIGKAGLQNYMKG